MTVPDLGHLFGQRPPQPDPAQAEAIEAYTQARAQLEVTEREILRRWEAVYCTCPPRRTRIDLNNPPGLSACLIHGQYMLAPDGRVL